ncbi:MAG TPA: amidohydrolase family protein [Beijerinckiaceae bacterium]|nr:amidohydrolase family protein [Beijerinckiaceae bacterium]
MTAIDMHAHYYGGLVDDLMKRSTRPFVSRNGQGRLVLNAMTASTEMSDGYTNLPARLAWMDRNGVATQLLTFPGALGVDVMPADEIAGPIRAFNDHLAAICAGSGGRFAGLAGLPLADTALAAAEMRRVRRDLRLAVFTLPGNYFLSIAAARTLAPVLAAANECGALVMIHPGLMPGEAPPEPYPDTSVYRASVLNLQASLAQMGLTVIAGELAEAYPRITFQLVNLGGTLPFVLERLEAVALSRPPYEPFPRAALRNMVYDCASLGPDALALAVKVFGADRVMLGSDYPIFSPEALGAIAEKADISDAERALVLSGTAVRVLESLR